ncbi:AraC family transcriptional regulator [Gordonia araii NBRC 100433]|uniref:AraC family transcriptional regulator n=1 Tax=Gordonia araii NBRC 100433 TaxID=1073574 RepID=G7GZP8_9ACTN|nr:AraC family transcriptional regulator [Gordonia araii]NNG98864.1 helix-turn-helix transcriptional regulator [Gordonia araii NBRC 100433]GAB09073.1 AraC family transcriptional regulator [Gordonia araii NBRC 100433]
MTVAALPETCAAARLWVWPGHGVYLGESLGLQPHTTSVPCIVIGVDEEFTLAVGDERVRTRSALIVPRVEHQIVAAPPSRMLFCYVDAGRAELADWASRATVGPGGCSVRLPTESVLAGMCRDSDPDPMKIVATATGRRSRTLDPRITSVVGLLLDDPTAAPDAKGLAARAGWSTSHFLRRFSRETGTSLRRYRLWARMLRAAGTVADGGDLTTAAADAGFSSPSHFSDTFLRMFGLTASDLIGSGAELIVVDERQAATA